MFSKANEGDCPTHIIIMFKNRFFKLDAFSPDRKPLDMNEFYHQLKSILDDYENKPHGIGIGALTADRRESWAQVCINLNAIKYI